MNGYKNPETFYAVLWLENEESTYKYLRKMGKILDEYELAEHIQEFLEERNPLILLERDTDVYTDLLEHALSQIDYLELAERFKEE